MRVRIKRSSIRQRALWPRQKRRWHSPSGVRAHLGTIGIQGHLQTGFDSKKSTVEVDQAQMESAEAALETAQLNLEYCYIHSPIQGRAGARLVDIGNVVQANTTGLLLIQRLDPIYADFTITERDLPNVQKR